MKRRPLATLLISATAAVGIAATALVFSLFHQVLAFPPPFPDAETLAVLDYGAVRIRTTDDSVFVVDAALEDPRIIKSFGLFHLGAVNFSDGQTSRRVGATLVDTSFFSTLHVPPVAGRTFTSSDHFRDRIAVLSHRLARLVDSGRPADAVGRSIRLNGETFTVIGVMPEVFDFPTGSAVWLLPYAEPQVTNGLFIPSIVLRLAHGVTLATAERFIRDTTRRQKTTLMSLHARLSDPARRPLTLLALLALFVFIATNTNISAIIVALIQGRRLELGIRRVLGATETAVVGGALLDVAIAVCIGALAALGVLRMGALQLSALLNASGQVASPTHLFQWYGGAAGATLLSSLVTTWLVVRRLSRNARAESANGMAASGVQSRRFRFGLVVAQVAVSLIATSLTLGAVRGLWQLSQTDLGLDGPPGTVFAEIVLPNARYESDEAALALAERLGAALETISSGQAGITNIVPGSASVPFVSGIAIDGRPLPAGAKAPVAQRLSATASFLSAAGVRVVAGRLLSPGDGRGEPVCVLSVSAASALQVSPGDAIDRRVAFDSGEMARVVGVVQDVLLGGPKVAARPQVFEPVAQRGLKERVLGFAVFMADSAVAVQEITRAVQGIDPELPVFNASTLEARRRAFLSVETNAAMLAAGAALVTILLFAAGLYGILAEITAARTREFALELALGAAPSRLMGKVVATAARVVMAGILLGVIASVTLIKLAGWLAFVQMDFNIAAMPIAGSFVGILGIATALVPAWRVASIDPARLLSVR